jgi:O-antigen/teichoic acid export membrane protein
METAFFRFSEQQEKNRNTIFSTAFLSVFTLSFLFVSTTILFRQDIADLLRYPDHPEYILWFGIIISLDAVFSIPFARLRAENRPVLFATIKLAGIGLNIALVLFFVVASPWLVQENIPFLGHLVQSFYNPELGVGYVFIANLASSILTSVLLLPVLFRNRMSFSTGHWRYMIIYALPLLVSGLAGIINEALDKILLKYLLPEEIAMSQLGIYGACYRVSVLMVLFIQAFRFAAEPFFFAEYKNANAPQLYARVMNVFVITCLIIFLGIMMYMDIIQYFIGADFREGLHIVPVLLIAHMFLGIYFNLSVWYKVTGKTHYGAMIAVTGALITIFSNILLIPVFGYTGSAWAHLICYVSMAVISWILGRKHYPVPYNMSKIFLLIISALVIYFAHAQIPIISRPLHWLLSAFFLAGFVLAVWFIDAETRQVLKPLLDKIVRKK